MCNRFCLANLPKPQAFSARRLLLYAAPALPLAMLSGPVFVALPTYYARDLGLPLASVGFAFLLSRLWDMLCDPLVGLSADRLRCRFGRRRPLLLVGLPLVVLGGLFLLVYADKQTPLTIALWSVLLYTGWTMMKLSHDAWGAELSQDYQERVRITAYRETLALIGGIVAIALIGYGVLPQGPGLDGSDLAAPGLGVAFSLLYFAMAGLLAISVAGALYALPDAIVVQKKPFWAGLWADCLSLRATLANNKALQKLSIAFVLNGLAASLPGTLFLLFVEHVLGRPDLQGPLLLLYFICAVFAAPFWHWAGLRLGKHRAWLASMGLASLAFLPALFLPWLGGQPLGLWLFVGICCLTGFCLSGDVILPPAIQADILDEDRLATGAERAGLLFAWLGLLQKLSLAAPIGFAFPLLEGAGFQTSQNNTPEALWLLTLLYAGVPILLKLLACLSLRRFPLDLARQQWLRAQINPSLDR
jgi:glycoside/pentoside/hexuronide:cation symporter, GPH family